MEFRKAIPTLNRFGYQMASPNPLVNDWIMSYDGVHPLLDVGCAFGINTFEALKRGIPVFALDRDEGHLDFIRKHLTSEHTRLATCIFGSLPTNIPVPDTSISGILASEVLHFLNGSEVEESLNIFRRKLIKGGKLIVTAMSDKVLPYFVNEEKQKNFNRCLGVGEKWPGIVKIDEEFLAKVSTHIKSVDPKNDFVDRMPDFCQVFSERQITDALESIGFVVKMSKYDRISGHPDQEGIGKLPDVIVKVVAEKKQLLP